MARTTVEVQLEAALRAADDKITKLEESHRNSELANNVNHQRAMSAIYLERLAQIKQWGIQHHSHEVWLRILAEEFGEIARALNDDDPIEHITEEIVQTAAVAVSWLEDIFYQAGLERFTFDFQVGGSQ